MSLCPNKAIFFLVLCNATLTLLGQDRPNSGPDKNQVSSAPSSVPRREQTQPLPHVPLLEAVSTGNVQCDQNWNVSQSALVVSPSGIRVRVELRGKTILGKTQDDNRCVTTWTVHVTRKDTSEAIVADTRDDDWYDEHFFEINGWSRDGRFLLMSIITDAGDWDETIPLVYDVKDKKIWQSELGPLFGRFVPESCLLYFRPLGFTLANRVLVDVGPLDADDLAPGEKPCFQTSRWQLDYIQKKVTRVPAKTTAEAFGTVQAKK
jgi:hypothetical protein